ncbi:MAG TPA: ubiquinone/menaquinone biosynthesis methyltransferase [Gemmatimonadaceae bacterium]|nr:ubiquinone/menaquinone biosynthesis methyltransferase [Gemmatimonadaceae bacterium]
MPAPQREPPRLSELDLETHLADPSLKQRFVTPMFDIIAPRYDRFTRVFSFGMDRRWKSELTSWMRENVGATAHVLDLACGTGDLAFAAARFATRGQVVGVDASPAMIALARERATRGPEGMRTAFVEGDISSLDMATASVDVVTAGYALRNVPEYDRAVAEIVRVLKPGGVVAMLDFYRPENGLWRALFLWYLSVAGNLIGWLWHREPVVYGYIARSIDHFVSWQTFAVALEQHGLTVQRVQTKLFGGVAIHYARRV